MRVSVTIITKNEELSIKRCLQSVSWADEVIVLDSGSTDRTVEIAREMGAKVTVSDDWPGFGPQKNRALDLATGNWIFSLDADEWVTPELGEEIRSTISGNPAFDTYRLPRSSSFCGRFMRHSGWWPDYVVRLFRRGTARFSDDIVHERTLVDGDVGTLRNPLLHETYVDLEDMQEKFNRYSTLGAQTLHKRGARGGLGKASLHGLSAFIRTYLLRRGFLDGREGFMLAVANAEVAYYKYVKLLLLSSPRK
jgi:glycosyltransferase involved in cell wall biosynthesis